MTPDEAKAEREAIAFGEAIQKSLDNNTRAIREVRLWKERIARRFAISISLIIVSFLLVAATLVKVDQEKIDACRGSNAVRSESVGLWSYLVHISPPPPHETPAEARRRQDTIHAFMARVRIVYHPIKCTGIF
jgi:hypothetical protein